MSVDLTSLWPQSRILLMFIPTMHWLFLESSKWASYMLTNQYVSCSHRRKSPLLHNSLPVPFLWLLKLILMSVCMSTVGWCVVSAHSQSHPSSRSLGSLGSRDGALSFLYSPILPYINQAQKLLYLYLGVSQTLVNNLVGS